MKQSLFILIIGIILGSAYHTHDGFKEWADDSYDTVAKKVKSFVSDSKEKASDSISDSFDEMKDEAKKKMEEKYEALTTKVEEGAEEVKEAAEK